MVQPSLLADWQTVLKTPFEYLSVSVSGKEELLEISCIQNIDVSPVFCLQVMKIYGLKRLVLLSMNVAVICSSNSPLSTILRSNEPLQQQFLFLLLLCQISC